jgi:hypothetical protein
MTNNKRKIVPYPIHNPSNTTSLSEHKDSLEVFKDKPFWIWDQQEHNKQFIASEGKCCHVDILGRPQKDAVDFPIFDYEKLIYDAVEQNQSVWILKSRGIGLSTFMLYYLTWKILSSSQLDYESIFIISGTREEHANYLKEKMAKLFERNFPLLNLYTKYTELVLKNTWIKVFPSTVNSIKDIRGYFSAKYIWVDESAYLPENVQEELIHAITPYQTKSNATIILSSTPFRPNDMMQQIELDNNSKYFKLKLPYTYGLNRIYNKAEIESKMHDREFEREFNCKYLGKAGNLINQQQLETIMSLGKQYSPDVMPVNLYTLKACGVDWGYGSSVGSSASAIVCVEHMAKQFKEGAISQDIVRVTDCVLLEQSTPDEVIDACWDIWKKYGYMNVKFLCDASGAGMIRQMKIRWSDNLHWRRVEDVNPNTNHIIPVAFSTNHKQMLSHLHLMATKGLLAIDPKFDKLITSLRTAWADELTLNKEATSFDDLLDGLRLSLKAFNFK